MPFEPRSLDPAYLHKNAITLGEIGGVYDFIQARFKERHRYILSKIIPFKALNDRAMLPSKAYNDDAGLDLFICFAEDDYQVWDLEPGEFRDIPTGVAVELPEDTWAMIAGRSSTLRKRGLLVNTGIIDRGYRGELFVGVQNLSPETVHIDHGERLAQLIIMDQPSQRLTPIFVDRLSEHPRGENGFGSTGL